MNPLLGTVFIQNGGEGYASYHFDAEDEIYISYEAADFQLDSGRSFPDQKYFVDISFDLDDRAFLGTIDWSEPEGSTVGGAERWEYLMVFDEDYQVIESGSVLLIDSRGGTLDEIYFGSDLEYERAR
ncbi:MAG TPA: hypothetical protein DFR83_12690 [Deltaproteobacteria bacterium]|nr:hypothetical protein [Deltaproteobacteria bacterium]